MSSFQELLNKHQIELRNTFSNKEKNLIENIFNKCIEINNIDICFLQNHYILNIIGLYYECIVKDYVLMKKYYLMAIDLGDIDSMINLGTYYECVEKDYELMKKYYLMAVELDDIDSMIDLGLYYENVEKDYELMKKYYLMAIDLGDSIAMNNLGLYYECIEKDYGLMKKYYLMAITPIYKKMGHFIIFLNMLIFI